jgi:hypothetical protein
MAWEVVAIVLLGGAAVAGIASLVGQYRRLRDLRDRHWN